MYCGGKIKNQNYIMVISFIVYECRYIMVISFIVYKCRLLLLSLCCCCCLYSVKYYGWLLFRAQFTSHSLEFVVQIMPHYYYLNRKAQFLSWPNMVGSCSSIFRTHWSSTTFLNPNNSLVLTKIFPPSALMPFSFQNFLCQTLVPMDQNVQSIP